MKNGTTLQIDSNMTMDEFFFACSNRLKMKTKRAFNTNGEEITDITYITQDDHIYLTDGDELQSSIINAYFDISHKKSLNTDFRINLIILGPPGVGKSSLIIRYVHQQFSDLYIPTVEAYFNKVEKVDDETYELSIVDTSGTEEWATLQYEYMSNKDAVLLAYSIERRENLEAIEKVYQELRLNNQDIPIVLVANKADLRKRCITTAEGQALADKMKAPYFEVSAKQNKNITELFFELIRTVAKKKKEYMPDSPRKSTEDDDEIKFQPSNKGWTAWFFDKCCLV